MKMKQKNVQNGSIGSFRKRSKKYILFWTMDMFSVVMLSQAVPRSKTAKVVHD